MSTEMSLAKAKKILAIIPARRGSKRLPGKNCRILGGLPLVAWTIIAAKKVEHLVDVIVSTDDPEVIRIAREFNCAVIERPSALAADSSTSEDVVMHALNNSEKDYEHLMLLQPTSPFRRAEDITNAINEMKLKGASSIISVVEAEHSPLWCGELAENGSMENFIDRKVTAKPAQELPQYHRLNGAIYLVTVSEFVAQKSFFLEKNCFALKMEKNVSVDIDDMHDFLFAEKLLECGLVQREKV